MTGWNGERALATQVTNDQAMLIEAAREFARAELLERDRAWDADESSMTEVLPQLAEMGLMNLTLSEELGGLGCSYRVYADILHELAYASPSVAVAMSVHNMVGQILAEYAERATTPPAACQYSTRRFAGQAIRAPGSPPGTSRLAVVLCAHRHPTSAAARRDPWAAERTGSRCPTSESTGP